MAGDGFEITVDDRDLQEKLKKLARAVFNTKPFFEEVGEIIKTSVVRNFEVGGRYRAPGDWRGGLLKWQETAVFTGRKVLIDQSLLLGSINWRAGLDSVEIGSNVVYSAIHNFGGKESDVSFTAGLIHDAGVIALTVCFPTAFAKVQDFMDENQISLIEAEKQTLGFSHLEVAGEMMEAWGFPPQLSQVILQCAAPAKNKMNWEIAGVVALAKSLASEWGFSSGLKDFAETGRDHLLALLEISANELQKWEPELKKYAEFALDTIKIS